jgi:hypothetical protein
MPELEINYLLFTVYCLLLKSWWESVLKEIILLSLCVKDTVRCIKYVEGERPNNFSKSFNAEVLVLGRFL